MESKDLQQRTGGYRTEAETGQLALEIEQAYEEELREEENIVEAVLFTMGKSVGLPQLALALNANEKAAEAACERLKTRYERERRGIQIQRFADCYQMSSSPAYYEPLIRVAANPKKPVLTDIVLETLAIIAYKQPVTKAEIEKIRGVKSDHAVNRLVEYELVYEVGRLDAPGRPALFGTTEEFLRRFGVSSTDHLPGLKPELQAEIEAEVKEELSEVLGEAVVIETDQETHQWHVALKEDTTERAAEDIAPWVGETDTENAERRETADRAAAQEIDETEERKTEHEQSGEIS